MQNSNAGTIHDNNTSNIEDNSFANYVFRVEDDNYKLDKEVFKILYPYTKVYLIPRTIDKLTFESFLNLIGNNKKLSFDLTQTHKLVTVSDYFKFFPLIERLVKDSIFPQLDKNSCLKIIKDYIRKLYDNQTKQLFISLIQCAIDLAADNIFYLINMKYNELISIGLDPIEEIIEHYFETVIFNPNIDHSLIMRLLMKIRKLNDIYDLLENERKRSISNFEKLHFETDTRNLEPSIIWNIKCDKPTEGFYKESEEFQFEQISLVLINYYDAIKDICSIAIKIKSISNDSSNETNNNMNHQLPDKYQFIISLLSICEIPEIDLKTKINFNCIFTNLKSKVLICKIENFSQKFSDFESLDYNLSIYFNISYNFSMILTHICRTFYEYYSLPSIGKLSKNVVSIVLKYENLKVKNEDEVLEAVTIWGKST